MMRLRRRTGRHSARALRSRRWRPRPRASAEPMWLYGRMCAVMPDHAHVDSTISRRSANTMGSSAYFRKGCRGGFRHMWFVTDQRVGLERHAAPRKLAVASTIATRPVVSIARSRVHLGTHSRSEVGCGAVLPCDLAGADRSLARRTPARPRTAVPLAANISRDWSGTAAPAALRTPSLDARVGHCRHHGRAPSVAAARRRRRAGCRRLRR